MRQKELRIALVCYGGISLAVYMHGVTKELWKLNRASRAFLAGEREATGTESVYLRLLQKLERERGLRLRVLTDIVAGASAGGINGVFLAQAIHSGQSLEPLTKLWLERADVEILLDPDARPWSRFAKFWATPIVWFLLTRPGNMVSASVAPETRAEVRRKLSRFIRSRWFEPPFGGMGFSRLLCEALKAMETSETEAPLLPEGHPLDLFVTATDFKGHLQRLRMNSPPIVQESEHRLSIGFRAITPGQSGHMLASPLELIFAARATASFPGAFPALQLSEMDALAHEHGMEWSSRDAFLARIMPEHWRRGEVENVSLIDGSVLVNAPFADAIQVLGKRPAHREVDRRFVYIDPRPDKIGGLQRSDPHPPGFFSMLFGSLSSIPREQPVRDNLEVLTRKSREMGVLRSIVAGVEPEVDAAVEDLFGWTLFLDRPTRKRLASWRNKAQDAAAKQAGYAYNAYANVKIAGIVDELAALIRGAVPDFCDLPPDTIAVIIGGYLSTHLDLGTIINPKNGRVTENGVAFFRDHDLPYRIRRLRLLARRLTEDWAGLPDIPDADREEARDAVYHVLALYLDKRQTEVLGDDFPELAANAFNDIGGVLKGMADRRKLTETDSIADAVLAEAMAEMPVPLRRKVLLTYLGFPFYDTLTLPLLWGEGLTEFNPVKVDRISPDDAPSIRPGGTHATLRGVEFYNFGAFFSRAYRENDYLWGRLHGAERMIDLVASVLPDNRHFSAEEMQEFKREAFLAILDEEEGQLNAEPGLVAGIRQEVLGRMPAR